MVEVFQQTPVTGALAASIFHYGEIAIADTKKSMAEAGLEVRC
ncbi:imidazole glycerol phosphate synthase subunit HisF [Chlamydia trachomatis]|nr:imidazole glycerol phosphate synthase subunit HisF [Chlamydia trachomatis]